MKKFILRLAALSITIVCIDIVVGFMCRYLQYHSKGGDTGRMMYIADRMNEQALIFGSSRAMHHYNPMIIEDSLGLTCYNCGSEGNGIIFCYGQYRLFADRYTPKVIIYDLNSSFDLINQNNDEKYLMGLRYFYDRKGIDSIFWSVNRNENWEMMSNMRKYNEKFIQLISDFHNPLHSDIKGYRPLPNTMKYEPIIKREKQGYIEYDALKLYYFQRLISDCKRKGTLLIFTLSPLYHSQHTSEFSPIISLAKKEKIPFINHYCDNDICNNKGFFQDTSHMNYKGADVYSKRIIKEIKKAISTQ